MACEKIGRKSENVRENVKTCEKILECEKMILQVVEIIKDRIFSQILCEKMRENCKSLIIQGLLTARKRPGGAQRTPYYVGGFLGRPAFPFAFNLERK